ncbi:NmrA family NAD(P)-binding protein [Phormidium tenue]|uniref:NmrA family transcriptional regulator n=1 Tax=Phormidium tenue NIES-30 TaxID=549789 RepID=A0A1U7J7R3_9CYAN|nr:NmrA family NAD(P)-binding protein [Phormidium tenue]MBD2231421.1 NmrA family NAD(P)-binding protein [Phormidium tenue FACHB-1052]OKH49178.1 NmrA family transcriptional regulator [Phormidium tenue NIES-30]
MHIILGGTGNVGSAVARALLNRREPVLVVTRNPLKAEELRRDGANVAVADVHDIETLRGIFRQGQRLFLLNPPAAPSLDMAAEERRSLAAILSAIDGADLQKIVAESTYGAQPGERIGDLGVLYEMEQALAAQLVPTTIIRAAYYMSNWCASLQSAREQGIIQTLFPADFKLPMVAPSDIGEVAARLMTEPIEQTGLHYVEGPDRYSSQDVATAFATALGRPVAAESIPRDQWLVMFKNIGFSNEAAESFANMTAATLDETFPDVDSVERGPTSLHNYLSQVVQSSDRR